jgi:hypothetical protein
MIITNGFFLSSKTILEIRSEKSGILFSRIAAGILEL